MPSSATAVRSGTGTVAAGGAFPVTVEHKFGKTTVEEEPQRVVTVGYTDQDAALAVGVVPVAVGDFLGGYDWRARPLAQDALGGAEPRVVAGRQINFEAVAAQRPDLIIAINAGLEQADYDKLARIAPTVAQSGDYIDFGMPWDGQTMLVAKALGREERGKQVVEQLTAKFRAGARGAPGVRRQVGHPRRRRPGTGCSTTRWTRSPPPSTAIPPRRWRSPSSAQRAPQRASPRDIAARPSEIQPEAMRASRPAGTSAKPSYQVSGSQMPSSIPSNGAMIGAAIR